MYISQLTYHSSIVGHDAGDAAVRDVMWDTGKGDYFRIAGYILQLNFRASKYQACFQQGPCIVFFRETHVAISVRHPYSSNRVIQLGV
jgi:hypothetical protein